MAQVIAYMNGSSAFAALMGQLSRSPQTYTVVVDPKGINEFLRPSDFGNSTNGNIIGWNPNLALVTKSGAVQSASMALGHEVDHAARYDDDPVQYAKDFPATHTLEPDPNGPGFVSTTGVSVNEAKATQAEGIMANQVGDVARQNYRDAKGQTTVQDPTYHGGVSNVK